jgi:general secretion pathway protein G
MTASSLIRSAGSAKSRARQGFTLVEILIVVIILGILAAIVIPQFTNASTQAKASNMASQDQTAKSQITLYSLQHNDQVPLVGTQGTDLWTQLTSITNPAGTIVAAGTAGAAGPYLQSAPVNPLTNTSAVDVVTTTPALGASVGTTYGWVYNSSTGEFHGVNLAGDVSDDGN